MTEKANINPEMMKWAVLRAGFKDGYENSLPNNIKEKYKSWESGKTKPTWNQLREVSKRYDSPSAFFSNQHLLKIMIYMI